MHSRLQAEHTKHRELLLGLEAGAIARASRAQDISRKVGLPRKRRGNRSSMSHAGSKSCFAQKMLEQSGDGGPLWESLWSCLSARDVIRVRVIDRSFNDANQNGGQAETDAIEPGHVSTERAMLSFPFTRPADLLLAARNTPYARRHSKSVLGSVSGLDGPEAGPATLRRAGRARTGAFA